MRIKFSFWLVVFVFLIPCLFAQEQSQAIPANTQVTVSNPVLTPVLPTGTSLSIGGARVYFKLPKFYSIAKAKEVLTPFHPGFKEAMHMKCTGDAIFTTNVKYYKKSYTPGTETAPDKLAFDVVIENLTTHIIHGTGSVLRIRLNNASFLYNNYLGETERDLSDISISPHSSAKITVGGWLMENFKKGDILSVEILDFPTKIDAASNVLERQNFVIPVKFNSDDSSQAIDIPAETKVCMQVNPNEN